MTLTLAPAAPLSSFVARDWASCCSEQGRLGVAAPCRSRPLRAARAPLVVARRLGDGRSVVGP